MCHIFMNKTYHLTIYEENVLTLYFSFILYSLRSVTVPFLYIVIESLTLSPPYYVTYTIYRDKQRRQKQHINLLTQQNVHIFC